MKKWLILCSFLLFLSGCMESRELKERTIIEAVGIDEKNGTYNLTFQQYEPSSGQGSGGKSDSSGKSKPVQSEGRSISEAIDTVTHYNGNEVFLGNSTYIVLGADMAKEGILQELHYFNGENEVSPSTMLIIAEKSASELLSKQAESKEQGSSSIGDILEQGQKNGVIADPTMADVLRCLVENSAAPYLPVISVVEKGDSSTVKVTGMAVFRGERMVDIIPIDEAKGILWADDKMERALLVVEDGELGILSAEVQKSKTSVTVTLNKGLPQFHLTVDCSAQLQEVIGADRGGTLNEKQQKRAQSLLEQEIKSLMETAIKRCFTEQSCDIFRFGQHLKKTQPHYWKQNESRWEELMKDCGISVSVRCSMSKTGQQAME